MAIFSGISLHCVDVLRSFLIGHGAANLGMSSSVSSYNVNSGYTGQTSPERKSKHRASSTVPAANNETETDTDMEMAVDEQKSP